MFCENCGKKAKKGDIYCEGCGNKLKVEEETNEQEEISTFKETKPMDKETKRKIIIVGVLLVILFGANYFIKKTFSPEKVAENYFDATIKNDIDKLYEFYDLEDSKFTTKKMFKKIKNNKDSKTPEITNYNIKDAKYEDMNMEAIVEITYHQKGIDDNKTLNVHLYKDKKKKFLFYDNWRVEANLNDVVKDYKIKVPKNSKVTVEEINIDKYKDKKSSDDSFDVYVIKELFKGKYNIKTIIPGGIENVEEVNVSNYSIYMPTFNVSKLSKKSVQNIENLGKEEVEKFYNNIILGKEFKDIENEYKYKDIDLDNLDEAYTYILNNFTKYNRKLKSFEVKDIKLNRFYMNEKGEISFSFEANYKYNVEFKSGEEIKTHDDTQEDSFTLVYKNYSNKIKLIDAKYLASYFSIY